MFAKNIREMEKKQVSGEGIKNVFKQVPIGPEQGWKDYILRVFTVQPGGYTSKHRHEWEHINYVICGKGTLEVEGKKQELATGHFAVVPPGVGHQYFNSGNEDFVMICIVPSRGDY